MRRAQILAAAHDVLATRGYAEFTLRNIAVAAGLHFATLQYHFPSKANLLAALIQSQLETNRRQLDDAMGGAGGTPAERFRAAIGLITQANRDASVTGFFFQLWSLANHDRDAARSAAMFYDAYAGWIQDLVLAAQPALGRRDARLRAFAILAMLEGMLPALLLGSDAALPARQLDDFLAGVAWDIATKPPAA